MLKTSFTYTLVDYKKTTAKVFFFITFKNPRIIRLGHFWWLSFISLMGAFLLNTTIFSEIGRYGFFLSSDSNQLLIEIINVLVGIIEVLLSVGVTTGLLFLAAYVAYEAKTRHLVLKQVINRKHELTLDEFQITLETDIIKLKCKKEDVRAIKLDKDFLYVLTKNLGLRVIPIRAITGEMKELLEKNWKL
jgi:hypothetical protein